MNDDKKYEDGAGAVVGIIIIIIVILVGAIYFLGEHAKLGGEAPQAASSSVSDNSAATGSDDINSLEGDAANMNFDNLGQGEDQLQ